MKYRNRRNWKRVIASPVALVIFTIAFAVVFKATWNMAEKSRGSAERLAQAQTALDNLKSREGSLKEQVAYLSTDEGVEAELRSKFRAAMEGESVAVIVGESSSESSQESTTTQKSPWWRRLLRFVGF